MDIEDDRVAEDFIAILPRYQWTIQKRGDAEVGVEERSGYHMQTNLHVPLDGEQDAQTALNAAFEHGVTDIIAFDYHNDGLNELKADARVRALDAANDKADALLRELFGDQRPKVINVQEHTVVHRPQSQYQSFTNTVDQSITTAPRQGMPLIGAIRPRNTYYRGLQSGADIEPQRLALRPEISVVSTVRLYYESPTAKNNKPNAAKRAKREP